MAAAAPASPAPIPSISESINFKDHTIIPVVMVTDLEMPRSIRNERSAKLKGEMSILETEKQELIKGVTDSIKSPNTHMLIFKDPESGFPLTLDTIFHKEDVERQCKIAQEGFAKWVKDRKSEFSLDPSAFKPEFETEPSTPDELNSLDRSSYILRSIAMMGKAYVDDLFPEFNDVDKTPRPTVCTLRIGLWAFKKKLLSKTKCLAGSKFEHLKKNPSFGYQIDGFTKPTGHLELPVVNNVEIFRLDSAPNNRGTNVFLNSGTMLALVDLSHESINKMCIFPEVKVESEEIRKKVIEKVNKSVEPLMLGFSSTDTAICYGPDSIKCVMLSSSIDSELKVGTGILNSLMQSFKIVPPVEPAPAAAPSSDAPGPADYPPAAADPELEPDIDIFAPGRKFKPGFFAKIFGGAEDRLRGIKPNEGMLQQPILEDEGNNRIVNSDL